MILRQSCRCGARHRHFGSHRSLPEDLTSWPSEALQRRAELVRLTERAKRDWLAAEEATEPQSDLRGTGGLVIIPVLLKHDFYQSDLTSSEAFSSPARRQAQIPPVS